MVPKVRFGFDELNNHSKRENSIEERVFNLVNQT